MQTNHRSTQLNEIKHRYIDPDTQGAIQLAEFYAKSPQLTPALDKRLLDALHRLTQYNAELERILEPSP